MSFPELENVRLRAKQYPEDEAPGLHEQDSQLVLQGKVDQLRETRETIADNGCSFQSFSR